MDISPRALAWPARTARLALRPATEGDAALTWRYRRLEVTSRWIPAAPGSEDEFRRYFTQADRLAHTLVVELGQAVIGDLMLAIRDGWAQVEIEARARGVEADLGWCLDPGLTGRGYATEAVRELLRISFDGLGLRRVTAGCFAGNEPSWRLMERLGMRREAHRRRHALHRDGEWLDVYDYAMLADEWRQLGP